VDMGISFIANLQSSEGVQPGNRALDDPTRFTQTATVRCAQPGKQRSDATLAQASAVRVGTIATVALHDFWLAQRASALAAHAGNRVYRRIQLGDIVNIRTSQDDRERDALRVDDDVVLAAELAPVRRIGACFFPAAIARIEELSTMARAISSCPRRRSSANSVSCIRCQTPAFCHATSRRQQAVPEPQPISWGSRFHAIPERSTNTMPASMARSGVGLRPAYWRLRGSRAGSNGSMSDHSSSSMNSLAIASCRAKQDRKLLRFPFVVSGENPRKPLITGLRCEFMPDSTSAKVSNSSRKKLTAPMGNFATAS